MPAASVAQMMTEAVEHHRLGDLRRAESLYGKVLRVDSAHADAMHLLGVLSHQQGDDSQAVDRLQRAVLLNGTNAAYHCNLGTALQAVGELDRAAESLFRARDLAPRSAEIAYNLGNVLTDLGLRNEAAAEFHRAIALQPDHAKAHNNLGNALQAADQSDEAEHEFRRALEIEPGFTEAHFNLANLLHGRGEHREAVDCYMQAVRLNPGYAAVWNNLGIAQRALGDETAAAFAYGKAIECDPTFAAAHFNLANTWVARQKLDAAVRSFRAALDLQPDYADAHHNLGRALSDQGKVDAAQQHFQQAVQLQPESAIHADSHLLTINFQPAHDGSSLFAAHRAWGSAFEKLTATAAPHDNSVDSDRKLRIGYVSADFRAHPIVRFLAPFLIHHDRSRFEIACYAAMSKPDRVTRGLKQFVPQWRDIAALSDDEADALIRRDGIDILVDLSGHTGGNRLPLFARKPAPVQVTYLGYPGTTGLSGIDYRLTDDIADPADEPVRHTEQLWRLPHGFACFRPVTSAPDIEPPPVLRRGSITFGSLHALSRLSDATLDGWTRVLHLEPSARLLLAPRSLSRGGQEFLLRRLAARGVASERIEFRSTTGKNSGHLKVYEEIDISLDTLPWNGHTTICESLWMGVPAVAWRGERFSSRMVASVLTQIGLSDLIAETADDFARIAIALAADVDRLSRLRFELRQMMQQSPLCDAVGFTTSLESAYREMWRRWCVGRERSS